MLPRGSQINWQTIELQTLKKLLDRPIEVLNIQVDFFPKPCEVLCHLQHQGDYACVFVRARE